MTAPIRTLRQLSCIVPVYNEAKNLPQFIPQLTAECLKFAQKLDIIVIDDGSHDDTITVLKQLQQTYDLRVLIFSRNFGKEAALTAGLNHVSPQSDATILIDADFQHPLACIQTFITEWQQGYEMVYGVRLHRKDRPMTLRVLSTFFYKLIDRITPIEIPHDAGDFRLLDREVVAALNQLTERERFMKGLYAWVGFSKKAIAYLPEERSQGQSSWGFKKLIELAITGITSFSNLPLRMWSIIGAVISSLSLLYALSIILDTLLNGVDLPGYATITVAITFLGGIQLLSIGILGEYIARIFTEVKQRPPYIISRILTSDLPK
ncbi:MAG: glycosyltransferase family 2 protein [Gammaproteobacteria bacterium]|nr:glycosyltransferase family 2 protein [Gammaproteobacteria bacterium]